MSEQRYVRGDPWAICDRCGLKFRMSQTLKTWDGLRVCRADWEPKHPQLMVRGRIDRQAVKDARPEEPDQFITPAYGVGPMTLMSANGTVFVVTVDGDGALRVTSTGFQSAVAEVAIGTKALTVDNDGAITVTTATVTGPTTWLMPPYQITIASDNAVLVTSL